MGWLIFHQFPFFCAGVFFHISVIRFFRFEETASHPMIRMRKSPKLRENVQLFSGLSILILLKYRSGIIPESVFLFAVFCLCGMMRAVFLESAGFRQNIEKFFFNRSTDFCLFSRSESS
jgi:hypothetical protein